MKIKYINTLFIILCSFIIGCSPKTKISFSCDKDTDGDYLIKWEVYPMAKPTDKISIYMSDNDSIFTNTPILTTNVNDYVAEVQSPSNFERKFFKLKVGNSSSGIISNRIFSLDRIQNFRDLGGYYTKDDRQIKWNMIYRSGDFSSISTNDYTILQNLNIKTIVDLREPTEYRYYPDLYRGDKIIYLPIKTSNRAYMRQKIVDGSFLRNDAIIFTRNIYKTIIDDYSDSYAKLFDILCDEDNYPLVFNGHLGKDKVGLASYFILVALGVDSETIKDDYLLSNNSISERKVIGEARYMPEAVQEAATVMCKVHVSYLNYAENYIIEKNGSVEAYMTNKLKLTPKKIERLKKILMYPKLKD